MTERRAVLSVSPLARFARWRRDRARAKADLRRRRAELFQAARVARWESAQRRRLVAAGLPAEIVNAPLTTPPHLVDDDAPTARLDLSGLIPQPRREDD